MPFTLEARGLCKAYGGLVVASEINLLFKAGERTALIGPNGAGKTTLAGLLSGLIRPSSGEILLDGRNISRLSEAERVRAGIARTFQITTLFNDFTPRNHVRLAILERSRRAHRIARSFASYPDVEQETSDILARLKLTDVADRKVQYLAYGQQRLVEIALALALRPRMLLLDEPAAGVPTGESEIIFDAITDLPADLSVLIIEHNMDIVFRFAKKIIVLVAGAVLAVGTPEEILADPRVREVYLGNSHHA